jgi:DNA ligase (NAD+)
MIDPVKEIERLRKEIQRHDNLYYIEAKPEISDQEYDRLFHDLKKLEKKHPKLVTSDSPTQRVGESLTKGFKSVRHPFPLRSLDNSYNEADLLDFNRRVIEGLEGEKPEYVCELKFDGVSVLLHYENGKFAGGSTRGDGETGDDISSNLKTIKSLPLSLTISNASIEIPKDFYARSEVFMKLADFNAFNELRFSE